MLAVIIAISIAIFGAGYITGAKITDKKHGVDKHFWEY